MIKMAYAGVILEKDGKILLQLRDNKPNILYPNHWGTFGGGVEKGETPKQTAVREIEEEIGVILSEADLEFFYEFEDPNGIVYVFKAEFPQGGIINLREGKEARFFSKEEIMNLDNLVPAIKDKLKIYWG